MNNDNRWVETLQKRQWVDLSYPAWPQSQKPTGKEWFPKPETRNWRKSFQTKRFQRRVEAQTESSWQDGLPICGQLQRTIREHAEATCISRRKKPRLESSIVSLFYLRFELQFLSCFVLGYVWLEQAFLPIWSVHLLHTLLCAFYTLYSIYSIYSILYTLSAPCN